MPKQDQGTPQVCGKKREETTVKHTKVFFSTELIQRKREDLNKEQTGFKAHVFCLFIWSTKEGHHIRPLML